MMVKKKSTRNKKVKEDIPNKLEKPVVAEYMRIFPPSRRLLINGVEICIEMDYGEKRIQSYLNKDGLIDIIRTFLKVAKRMINVEKLMSKKLDVSFDNDIDDEELEILLVSVERISHRSIEVLRMSTTTEI